MTVKALSIIEPYPSLILEGKKRIETRSYPTRYRGRILIHASATRIPKEWRHLVPLVSDVRPGYVLCYADIVDCVKMTEEFIQSVPDAEREVGFYSPGRYAWILDNVEPVEPFQAKGHLGLWNCEVPS